MMLEKRFIAIRDFLIKHQSLHELEILERYPKKLTPYDSWSHQVSKLTPMQKIDLENNLTTELELAPEHIEFLQEVKSLINIPKKNIDNLEIPKHLLRKISDKKQHEIKAINAITKDLNCQQYIDIGSGAGHLSSILLSKNLKKSLCVDAEEKFQQIGKIKLQRYAPEILERITFQTAFIDHKFKLPKTNNKNTSIIGLHPCGSLSNRLINLYIHGPQRHLLSYGCCFHKIDRADLHLSNLAKEKHPIFTDHSLQLGAKSFKTLNELANSKRQRVKFFRYALHLLMAEHFEESFTTFGSAPKSSYRGSFSDYVRAFYPKAFTIFTAEELNHFIEMKKNKDRITTMLNLGIIRSHIARLVELYIIIDRALFIKESISTVTVDIFEHFDRNISPRNVGILASK